MKNVVDQLKCCLIYMFIPMHLSLSLRCDFNQMKIIGLLLNYLIVFANSANTRQLLDVKLKYLDIETIQQSAVWAPMVASSATTILGESLVSTSSGHLLLSSR